MRATRVIQGSPLKILYQLLVTLQLLRKLALLQQELSHGPPQSKSSSLGHLHHQASGVEPSSNILVGDMPISKSNTLEVNIERAAFYNIDTRPSILSTTSNGGSELGPPPIQSKFMDDNTYEHR